MPDRLELTGDFVDARICFLEYKELTNEERIKYIEKWMTRNSVWFDAWAPVFAREHWLQYKRYIVGHHKLFGLD